MQKSVQECQTAVSNSEEKNLEMEGMNLPYLELREEMIRLLAGNAERLSADAMSSMIFCF